MRFYRLPAQMAVSTFRSTTTQERFINTTTKFWLSSSTWKTRRWSRLTVLIQALRRIQATYRGQSVLFPT